MSSQCDNGWCFIGTMVCAIIAWIGGLMTGIEMEALRGHPEQAQWQTVPMKKPKIEPYPDPISGGVQPEALEFPFSPK